MSTDKYEFFRSRDPLHRQTHIDWTEEEKKEFKRSRKCVRYEIKVKKRRFNHYLCHASSFFYCSTPKKTFFLYFCSQFLYFYTFFRLFSFSPSFACDIGRCFFSSRPYVFVCSDYRTGYIWCCIRVFDFIKGFSLLAAFFRRGVQALAKRRKQIVRNVFFSARAVLVEKVDGHINYQQKNHFSNVCALLQYHCRFASLSSSSSSSLNLHFHSHSLCFKKKRNPTKKTVRFHQIRSRNSNICSIQ